MTISESVKDQIIGLRGMSVRDIAKATGASPATVSRVLKAAGPVIVNETRNETEIETPQNETRNETSHAPARTRATRSRSVSKREVVFQNRDAEIVMPRVTRDMTIGEMADILQKAKDGYARAASQEDESKRTWMETSYMKIMKDVLIQMGKWCGLDSTITEDSRKDIIRRADVEGMSLDEMRDLVRDL